MPAEVMHNDADRRGTWVYYRPVPADLLDTGVPATV